MKSEIPMEFCGWNYDFPRAQILPGEGSETCGELVIDSIGGACPCQAQGTMNGRAFYFRARHGRWTLDVAEVGEDPIRSPYPLLIEEDGPDPWEGYMPADEARKIIERIFAENQTKLRKPT